MYIGQPKIGIENQNPFIAGTEYGGKINCEGCFADAALATAYSDYLSLILTGLVQHLAVTCLVIT